MSRKGMRRIGRRLATTDKPAAPKKLKAAVSLAELRQEMFRQQSRAVVRLPPIEPKP